MPTEDAMRGPYVETSRLRYDNGGAGRCRGAARQTQHGRRVAGLAAGRMDTRWHIRQEGREKMGGVLCNGPIGALSAT